jgi:LysR family transcriptional activator of dmlA
METKHSLLDNNDTLLRDLRLFLAVAKCSSFVAAAGDMGISPAYLTKRIATLEHGLGIKLFHRTTRRVSITDEGETVYDRARKIMENVEEMAQAVADLKSEPKGLLRISASLRLGRDHVSPILSLLRQRYPELEIWLELMDRRVDLIAENIDLDIRVGAVNEPHLIAHKIVANRRVLCAAPSYIALRGQPKTLAELSQHDCIVFRERDQSFGVWKLYGPGGQETVKVTGPMASNHSDIVRQWAHDGHGIIMASVWDVAKNLEDGSLVQILPMYSEPADVWAVTTVRSTSAAKVKVCVDLLKDQLTRGPFALQV